MNVMKAGHVGANANFGYILRHNIEPNGGGKRVNQFSLVYDVYFSGKGNGWASIANLDSKGDGDVFGARAMAALARAVEGMSRTIAKSRSPRSSGTGSSFHSTSLPGRTRNT